MWKKKTIEKEVVLTGVGVHTGKNVEVCLRPSFSGEIKFQMTDSGNLGFAVDAWHVESKNCTSLVHKNRRIHTVEHLMASLYALGIDSVVVQVKGGEVPIMDGSASCFVEAIQEAGVKELDEKKERRRVDRTLTVRDNEAFLSIYPGEDLRVSYTIEYGHPSIGKQELSLDVNPKSFRKEIAPARTFGFLKDVPALRAQGLAMGGSLENTVVLDESRILNGPLRYPDEFVRHKILDLIGDLSLQRAWVQGHFQAYKAGHSLHLKAVRGLLGSAGE
ncbi:UDP-3-O-[3-hydroxymyristoyl] N-acetylglucosamine deacetylase [bacterium]|nr:UDP-3-O-[3-hydroxymyristoyl] N-acetylglucosamine deacetylase [bacterium]